MATSTTPTSAFPPMEYRLLGRSGLKVSLLSLGSWVSFKTQVETDAAFVLMKAAFERGCNFFDNAEGYAEGESERIMGEVIKRGEAEKVWTRPELVVSTKIYFGKNAPNSRGLSRKHIVEGTVAALKRMQLDYVDLIFAHRPDPITPMEEVVRAFNHLIDRGLAFYWGTSEWSAAQIEQAIGIADRLGLIRPLMEQPEYNIFARERVEHEYSNLYRDYGLGTTIWSPLASGILTGKYSQGKFPEGSRLSLESLAWLKDRKLAAENKWQFEAADKLLPIAEELGCSLAQLSIAWCAKNPHVSTVILGATSLKQLEENFKALEVVPKITPELIKRIDEIIGNKPKLTAVEAQVRNLLNVDALGPK
ncbi:K+ channel protein [Capsaspora owczarzaki ATCC 30864]|uniref:K+ channel protein n=1 Tax=Capsaspora owczarzaki (strain ATCC 30864) TaxID=595528 RepID=A0A0D2VZE3_CAPO3|nr:K+ channel protein [Capsaspora owczarzaki ATCC 30864]KJE97207.1 K+ channel protein [Capsaspora owczarzaki ATCC 30864]|eukprot:XP_004343524.2 K+ channel protein [Capsaspora owczarzaki ATCC 30864]